MLRTQGVLFQSGKYGSFVKAVAQLPRRDGLCTVRGEIRKPSSALLDGHAVLQQRWDCDIPTVTLALPLATFDQSVFLSPYPYYNFKNAFWPVLQKTIEINRLTLSSPLLRPDLGELAKPDTKNGQDFRLAQSAQAISSSLFNLNTSQMSLIRS